MNSDQVSEIPVRSITARLVQAKKRGTDGNWYVGMVNVNLIAALLELYPTRAVPRQSKVVVYPLSICFFRSAQGVVVMQLSG